MTVLLVIATLVTFIVIDFVSSRGRPADETPARPQPDVPAVEPVWVAGLQMPDALHYHRGHTWARTVSPETVVVGIDDFARRLLGSATGVRTPALGTWLRQGAKAFSVKVDGHAADLVSPIEGEVVAVNDALRDRPQLATDDPYGRGWILKVRPAELSTGLRNLISGSLVRRFAEDAREGLDLRLMALSGSVLQDGGEPVAGFAQHLPAEDWRALVGEFLLT